MAEVLQKPDPELYCAKCKQNRAIHHYDWNCCCILSMKLKVDRSKKSPYLKCNI